MKKILIVFLILIPIHALAFDNWSNQDKILEGTWIVFHLLDWGTTLDIADHPREYRETNPLLGDHPSRDKVNALFLITVPVHIGISHVLPSKWRPYWQMLTIGMSGKTVLNNFSIGLKLSF